MNIMTKDLDLLKVLHVVGQELNLTKASDRLGLSQPALSHALKKLRSEFNDPLLVRGSRGLVATEKAKALFPKVKAFLDSAQELYQENPVKDFKTLKKRLVIGITAYAEMKIIEPLLQELEHQAPLVTLETHPLVEGFPKDALERGEMDLAIAAYFTTLPETYRVKTLGKDPHVCVGRKKHPYFKTKQSLNDYLEARHVKIAVPHNKESAIDIQLEKKKLKRNLVAELSNFVTPAQALQEQNLLLTCPRSLAETYAKMFDLKIAELPIATDGIETRMVWHEKNQADGFHRLVRDLIVKSFTSPWK